MQNIALCHGWRVALEAEPRMHSVKYWEIIADNLSKAGWSWGCVSAIDSEGRTIWIVDVHRGDGKRLVVQADEKLTAFVELESAIRTGREPAWILHTVVPLIPANHYRKRKHRDLATLPRDEGLPETDLHP